MIFRPYLALDLRTDYSPGQSESGRRRQEEDCVRRVDGDVPLLV